MTQNPLSLLKTGRERERRERERERERRESEREEMRGERERRQSLAISLILFLFPKCPVMGNSSVWRRGLSQIYTASYPVSSSPSSPLHLPSSPCLLRYFAPTVTSGLLGGDRRERDFIRPSPPATHHGWALRELLRGIFFFAGQGDICLYRANRPPLPLLFWCSCLRRQ